MNGEFMRKLALEVAPSWGVNTQPDSWGSAAFQDYDKVRYVMKQIVREWASEGKIERDTGFKRIMDFMEKEFPDFESRHKVKVLVPGAGLGRMNFEFVKRGFWCQGNEFSYHMLLASNYILNHAYTQSAYSIFPYIHTGSNQLSRALQTRPIFFPDVHPGSLLHQTQLDHPTINIGELMSIASGSFPDLYGPQDLSESQHYSRQPSAVEFREYNQELMDCCVTHFFIDTSSNVIEYLKTLNHCLKPGALWINFGPLLWHFEDAEDIHEIKRADGVTCSAPVKGLEMSLDDLLQLASNWFEIIHRESRIESAYASDTKAMGGWRYQCEFWVMRKKCNIASSLI
jgi:carnosine N-methyltransferase